MVTDHTRIDAASMRPGHMYAAHTIGGHDIVGEYLGIEVAHGEWSMLVHTGSGVVSLPLARVRSVEAHAA